MTSFLDSLDGAAPHLAQRLNLAVVAKSDPERLRAFAHERGWGRLRLLSSRNNTYSRDYHAETPEGEQMPILNVFIRNSDQIRHTWAAELMFAPRDEGMEVRHIDSVWPIWNVLDRRRPAAGPSSASPGCATTESRDASGSLASGPSPWLRSIGPRTRLLRQLNAGGMIEIHHFDNGASF